MVDDLPVRKQFQETPGGTGVSICGKRNSELVFLQPPGHGFLAIDREKGGAVFTGEKLRDVRKQKGMSQEQVAARMGIRPTNVSKWERGISAPNGVNMVKLLRVLGCELEEVTTE
ncbi:helix-turn-helix domain-containing protein [Streptomyces phaeochromogenes]|uniref:helix-turn-helix domain-containing protein n=1 Tax=Streptomyces phaeochromogenes TaxID=1923 RepID=UPI002E2851F2|nr:helix-turn-helix transcriptional regulator [Streptomyces phaeochromogenes]